MKLFWRNTTMSILWEVKQLNHCGYNLIECNTIDEFWEYVSPEKPLKVDDSPVFIYRGQADAKWKLIPKIYRNYGPTASTIKQEYNDYRELEAMIIEEFMEQCDLAGLRINNDSLEIRQNIKRNNRIKNPFEDPDKDYLEQLALAQHHGVPTRLLDWSRHSYVAAYFAASTALARRNEWKVDTKIAVWALDTKKLQSYRNIQLLKVPGGTSINIAPQYGVFTYVRPINYMNVTDEVKPLEEEFAISKDIPLWKMSLPVECSGDVLYKCRLYGISAATLFPGFDGAARAVLDLLNSYHPTVTQQ